MKDKSMRKRESIKYRIAVVFARHRVISMTCYFKNSRMIELFNELGVTVTKENRDDLNEALHDYLSVDYKNCAATWKMVRKRLKEDGEGFKERLKNVLSRFI